MGFRHVGPDWGYHPWLGFLGGILSLLLFGVLVGVLVWAVVRFTKERPYGGSGMTVVSGPPILAARSDAALDQLRMRYARGEIGRDDFLQTSRDLGSPAPASPFEVPPPAAVPPVDPSPSDPAS
jgi:uncharacterized membrane protein